MAARGYLSGNAMYTEQTFTNYWTDTGEPVDDHPRPCPRCGKMPTSEGYDACIGRVPGASDVCCGHGVEEPYIVFRGQWALDAIQWAKDRGVHE